MRRITGLLYAADVADRIPLFPLSTTLVPGLVLPLHIFEPRYRLLVQDLLKEPDEERREFGIVGMRLGRSVETDGVSALYPVGVTALLHQADELDDGRFDIVTTGHRRFQILGLDTGRPLAHATVEFLDEPEGSLDARLTAQVADAFHSYRAALGGQVQASVGDGVVPEDPTVLSYLVTAAMVLAQDDRQQLLAAPSTAERLARARELLAREAMLIQLTASVPSLDLPGVVPSAN